MRNPITQYLDKLRKIIFIYDGTRADEKASILEMLSSLPLTNTKKILDYHELLLFIAAHPENERIKNSTEKEFHRIGQYLQKTAHAPPNDLLDSGLPYTNIIRHFSHDLLLWMKTNPECTITIDSFSELDLNTMLAITLPPLEQELTTAGMGSEALLDALYVRKKERLNFILDQFSTLNTTLLVKDHLWESLKLYVEITLNNRRFSSSFNRIPIKKTFFHTQLLKHFEPEIWYNKRLPPPKKTNEKQRIEIADIIKKSLVLTLRETDPSTYMDENSLRLYELEHGISIAIYGMTPNRQMSLQSYIGYTLFKNGFPAAYGGSWVFGRSAMFGLNIFEPFRGGESGFMMCQLLRVYRQALKIDCFEVEPYQYGRDNPDGIKSGAFWFYYRHGFRPVEKSILKIAQEEHQKIKARPGYKTTPKTLLHFTECNLALMQSLKAPMKIYDLTHTITKMIGQKFNGNRKEAADACIQRFLMKTGRGIKYNENEKLVLTEMAFLAESLPINDDKRLAVLKKMIKMKPNDPYQYNQLLCDLLE